MGMSLLACNEDSANRKRPIQWSGSIKLRVKGMVSQCEDGIVIITTIVIVIIIIIIIMIRTAATAPQISRNRAMRDRSSILVSSTSVIAPKLRIKTNSEIFQSPLHYLLFDPSTWAHQLTR